jgi:hypothetical protein
MRQEDVMKLECGDVIEILGPMGENQNLKAIVLYVPEHGISVQVLTFDVHIGKVFRESKSFSIYYTRIVRVLGSIKDCF